MKNLRFIALLCVMAALTAGITSCESEDNDKKNDAKQILTFTVIGTPPVTATINEGAKTITASMPAGTNLTALAVSLSVSDKATVIPTSGSTLNFTNPVPFTVTAEDGSVAVYIATVTAASPIVSELTNNMINEGNKTLAVGTYLIKSDLSLNANRTLTVLPGTTFRFLQGKSMSISSGATLIAVGTEGAGRILFTSDRSPQMPGDWKYLKFDQSDGCKLEYCVFEYGGSMDHTQYGMVTVSACKVLVRNCTFRNSKYTGLYVGSNSSVLEQFNGNTFTDCGETQASSYPVVISYPVNLKEMGATNTINTAKGLSITWADVNENITLKKLNNNVPYLLKSGLEVTSSASSVTLTVEPGVNLQFNSGDLLKVNKNGRLIAKGTANEKIALTGIEKSAGYWAGVFFEDGSGGLLTGNEMEYCDVSYGGKLYATREGNIVCTGSSTGKISVKNCHIANSSGWGIWRLIPATLTSTNNTFASNAKGDLK